MTLTLLPDAIEMASPTLIESLRVCGLKVAISRSRGGNGASNPWARLGTVAHHLLEMAALSQLGTGGDDFAESFDSAWESAVADEARQSVQFPSEARWGEPSTWPSYADKRARTRRRARELSRQVADWTDADVHAEEFLSSDVDRLFGKPDLIVRLPLPHRIIDYKTGVVTEGDQASLKGSYRRQLLLYAQLERRATPDNPPTHLAVVPLKGDILEFIVDWEEVDAEVVEAGALMDRYNANLARPLELANPSPSTCGSCQHAAICPAFWLAADSSWGPEVIAIAGKLQAVMEATDGTVTLEVAASDGTLGQGEFVIKRLPTTTNPGLRSAEVGQLVRLVGGRPGGDPRTILPSAWSRIAIEDPQ